LVDGVRRALRQASLAAAEVESDPALDGGVTFPSDELMVRVTDRQRAPAGEASLAELEAAVRDVLQSAGLADELAVCPDDDLKASPTVFVKLASAPGAAGLADALGQALPVGG
ncbi:MAG: hypothetical protein ACR2N6_07795, partial [Miltoncostaeaceae bacterium]